MTQEETLDSGRRLLHYKLEAVVRGQRQVIEAQSVADGIQMRVEVGGQSQEKKVESHERTIVLDNLIVSHYQVLLDATGGLLRDKQAWWVMVPQRLAVVTATLSPAGEDTGTLAGQSVKLHKFSLEIGSTLIEFWSEAASNKLMRVSVPLQSLELTREGFELTAPPVGAQKMPVDYEDRQLTFPSSGLEIPGTLCLPIKREGRIPGIVMVAGSGPNDRDETIGPNKPFRDIAHGLAQVGIATLRYDKRTFAFRGKLDPKLVAQLTVKEEVIDDAVAALKYLAQLPEIDPGRLLLLGHSLGATLAPYVVEDAASVKGVILMAPAARPLDELIYDQVTLQMKLQGQSEEQIRTYVDGLRKQFAGVRSGQLADTERVFFAPAHYWRDLFRRNTLEAMANIKQPVLLLQGAKDIQAMRSEYELVRKTLAGNPAAKLETHLFPDLNHLFMKVEGESTGAEYGRASQVDPEVIQTIAVWVRGMAGAR
jgi:dienelactone hydrolase